MFQSGGSLTQKASPDSSLLHPLAVLFQALLKHFLCCFLEVLQFFISPCLYFMLILPQSPFICAALWLEILNQINDKT